MMRPAMEFVVVGSRLYGVDREGRVMVFRPEDSPSPRHRNAVRLMSSLLGRRRRRSSFRQGAAHRA